MKVFTTGQVARILGVHPCTVRKWFNMGYIRGYRIPGSQDRRIPLEYLVHDINGGLNIQPIAKEMALEKLADMKRAKVLIVSENPEEINNFMRFSSSCPSFKFVEVNNGFGAWTQAINFCPDCVVLDFSIRNADALQICRNLRRTKETKEAIIVALTNSSNGPPANDSEIDESFQSPFDTTKVAERIYALIAGRKELM